MKHEETYWPPKNEPMGETVFSTHFSCPLPPSEGEKQLDQPGFGLNICWNKPAEWWKPFLVLNVWHQNFQIGWLL